MGKSKMRKPKASNTAGENGPTVMEAAAESERMRVRRDAKRKKNLAAAQNVSQIKSMGDSCAKSPACMPSEIAGTMMMFPNQANGESVLKWCIKNGAVASVAQSVTNVGSIANA